MTGFELRILGPLEIGSGHRSSAVKGEKLRRLLSTLILGEGRVVSMDAIVDALWGERPPPGAIATVQSHVSHLRRLLAAYGLSDASSRLVAQGAGYVLSLDPEEVDSRQFEALVKAARTARSRGDDERAAAVFRAAFSLWRGPALDDVASEPFAQPAAVALEELRLGAYEELFDSELALGCHQAILPELNALARDHPLREALWAQLMTALYRSGRQGEALRAYQDLRRALVEEVGIDPSPRLQDLERKILDQSRDLEWGGRRPRPRSGGDLGPRLAEVFIGREAELAALDDWLDDAVAGQGRLVLVAGDAGIGKSALLRLFAARADARKLPVLWGRCWEGRGAPPFWPWAEVIASFRPEFGDGDRDDAVGQLFAATSAASGGDGSLRSFTPEDVRLRAFQQVASLFEQGDPTVVVLEDIQEADESSLQLLRFLVPRMASAPLLMLASHRSPGHAGSALSALLAEVVHHPVVRRIELAPLPDAIVDGIVQAALGPALAPSVGGAIRLRAEGNPFFVTELVRLVAATSSGASADVVDLSRRGIPSGVREVVQRRLANVGDIVVQVLVLAAVAGASFTVPVLEAVAIMPSDRLLDSLEEATAARLIEEVPGSYGRYRFTHSLVRDAVYAGISGVRRARLHAAVGRTLERLADRDVDTHLSELAHHYLIAAPDVGVDKALEYGRQAGEQAVRSLAFEEAVRIYATLLDLLDSLAPGDDRRTNLAFARAEALMRAGDVGTARAAFKALAEDAEARGDADLLAKAALGFGQAFEAQARDADLICLLEKALAALPPEKEGVRSRVLARLATAQYFTAAGDHRDAISRAAVDAAVSSGDEAALAHALSARHFALWDPDHLDARQEAAAEALRLAERTDDGELELDALTWTVMDALELGDAQSADAAMARHAELAERLRHGRHRSYAATWRGMRALLDARLSDSEAAARHALALGDRLSPLAQARYAAQLFFVRREQGRLAELEADAERILAEHSELRAGWLCLVGMIKLARRDVRRARELLDEVVEGCEDFPFDANWLAAQAHAAELCVGVGDRDQAAILLPILEPYADRCALIRFAPGCLGSVARYAGLLAELQSEHDRACAWFDRALAVNNRLRATTWLSHTQHEYARALAQRGRRGDRARASSLRGEALATARLRGLDALAHAIESTPEL